MNVYHFYNNITINGKKFNKIIDVTISKSIDNFIQTCTITCSKYLKRKDIAGNETFIFNDFNVNDNTILKRGAYVEVELGYAKEEAKINFKKENYFKGFIANIDLSDERVAKIVVEDYSFLLKKIQVNQNTKTLSLEEIGKLIVDKANDYLGSSKDAIGAEKLTINSAFADLKIQKFQANNANGLDILDLLKKNYLLQSFCTGNELRIGANFDSEFYNGLIPSSQIPVFSLYNRELIKDKQKQFYHYIISKSNLKYQFEDERRVCVVTRCINPKTGKTVEKQYGDFDGDKKQLTFVGDYTEAEIDNLTKQNAAKLRYTGFVKGSSFQCFGLPMIDLLSLVSFDGIGNINYLSGVFTLVGKSTYLVTGVNITFGEGGFRQDVIISNKISVDSDSESVEVSNLPVVEGLKTIEYK